MKQAHNTEAENKDTRVLAIEYWNELDIKQKFQLVRKYFAPDYTGKVTDEMKETIYNSEHPTPTPLPTGKYAGEFTSGEWRVIPARYSRKTDVLAWDINAINKEGTILTPICSILPKELCDKDYSGHLPNTNVSVQEAEANANLIAAAPAMYKALKDICEYEERGRANGEPRIAEKFYNQAKAILHNIK